MKRYDNDCFQNVKRLHSFSRVNFYSLREVFKFMRIGLGLDFGLVIFTRLSDASSILNIFSTGTTVSSLGILDLYKRIVISSPPEVFLGKGVLEKCSKFTREHPCRSAISIKLLCNFIQMTLPHGCSPVNLLHIFRTYFPKNTS